MYKSDQISIKKVRPLPYAYLRVLSFPAMSRSSTLAVLISAGLLAATPAVQGRPSAGGAILLVVNQGDHDLSFIDPASGRQTFTVDVGGITGHEVAATPDGRTAFVPVYGNTGVGKQGTDGRVITVVDLRQHKVAGSIDFGRGVRPHCAVFDKRRNLLYVTTELDQSISIIDPATLKIVGSIPTGQAQSHMLALSHDGRFGYTANVGPGTVSVLDMNARKTLAIIPISSNTQRIAISNDDKKVFTADQTKPQLAVIDTASNKLSGWIPLPAIGYGTAPTPDGRWLLVAMRGAHQVAAVDLQTSKVAHIIDVPDTPTEILIRPDGAVAYVSCGGKVAAINLSSWKVERLIQAGQNADGLAWAE
jgi:DNA-binding beta-propeller fold protein YncE